MSPGLLQLTAVQHQWWAILRRLQNAAAWLIIGARPCDHILPLLRQLHWLPVCPVVTFKILGLAHQSSAEVTPAYLADECRLLSDVRLSRRTLRSSSNDFRMQSSRGLTSLAAEASLLPVPDYGTTFHLNYSSQTCLSRCSGGNLSRYCSIATLSDFSVLVSALYKYSV